MLFWEFYKTSREPLTDASVIPRKNIDNLRGKGHQRKIATHRNFFSLSNTKIRPVSHYIDTEKTCYKNVS